MLSVLDSAVVVDHFANDLFKRLGRLPIERLLDGCRISLQGNSVFISKEPRVGDNVFFPVKACVGKRDLTKIPNGVKDPRGDNQIQGL